MHTRLIGAFGLPHEYSKTIMDLRNYYGPYIEDNKIMVFAVMSLDEFSIQEHLYTFNLSSFDRIIFRDGDLVLNKRGKALYTINGLNALLRDRGLPKGASIDWSELQGHLLSEHGIFPAIQKLKFVSYG